MRRAINIEYGFSMAVSPFHRLHHAEMRVFFEPTYCAQSEYYHPFLSAQKQSFFSTGAQIRFGHLYFQCESRASSDLETINNGVSQLPDDFSPLAMP